VTGGVEPMRSVSGVATRAKFGTNLRTTLHMPIKLLTCVRVVGSSTVVRKKRHLGNLRVTLVARRRPKTSSKCSTCSSCVLE